MLRDQNLIPLSRQHQHALALCVRIDRASPIAGADLAKWQSEITQQFQAEIRIHFAAEEKFLFPAAKTFSQLIPLVDELIADHCVLRKLFANAEAQHLSSTDLQVFAGHMSAHIRKEERQLFERMQELMTPPELAALGKQLEEELKEATQACALPAKPNEPNSPRS